jgi:hypothetical protein
MLDVIIGCYGLGFLVVLDVRVVLDARVSNILCRWILFLISISYIIICTIIGNEREMCPWAIYKYFGD